MTVEVKTDNFKGKVLDLIGKTEEFIRSNFAHASIEVAGGWGDQKPETSALTWMEKAVDEKTGEEMTIFIRARLQNNKVWAVAVQSPKYFAIVKYSDSDNKPYVCGVPKTNNDSEAATNWICHGEDNRYFNFGID